MPLPSEVLNEVIQLIQEYGLEHFGIYYGIYPALVTNNKDPEGEARVKIKCVDVGHSDELDEWVDPKGKTAGAKYGEFFPPEEGDIVDVWFIRGDPSRPGGYIGGCYPRKGEAVVPSDFKDGMDPTTKEPKVRGTITPGGIKVLYDDANDKITLQSSDGSSIVIEKGDVTVDLGTSLNPVNPNTMTVKSGTTNILRMYKGASPEVFKIGNGLRGIARQLDLVTSTPADDPSFWNWLQLISKFCGQPAPVKLLSRITQASLKAKTD